MRYVIYVKTKKDWKPVTSTDSYDKAVLLKVKLEEIDNKHNDGRIFKVLGENNES